MDKIRRKIIQTGVLTSIAATVFPSSLFAEWPKAAFDADTLDGALTSLAGSTSSAEGDIEIKAPEIAENGAVVPVTVSTNIKNVESISIFAEFNPSPLTSDFHFMGESEPFVSTRIKMAKTGRVIALVKADGKLYSASKTVKVTIGGCGG